MPINSPKDLQIQKRVFFLAFFVKKISLVIRRLPQKTKKYHFFYGLGLDKYDFPPYLCVTIKVLITAEVA